MKALIAYFLLLVLFALSFCNSASFEDFGIKRSKFLSSVRREGLPLKQNRLLEGKINKDLSLNFLRQEKVKKFEEFVDGRLKPDLVHAIAQRDKVFEQQKIFSDLRRNIENLEKNTVTNIRTLVNLGSEVYMQADIPDTKHIFVDVGLGFHVEFTWTEALNFITIREEKLAKEIEHYTHLIASIKAQIKMVCEGIRELLQLPVAEF